MSFQELENRSVRMRVPLEGAIALHAAARVVRGGEGMVVRSDLRFPPGTSMWLYPLEDDGNDSARCWEAVVDDSGEPVVVTLQ